MKKLERFVEMNPRPLHIDDIDEHLAVSAPLSEAMLTDIHRSANHQLDIHEVQEHVEGIRALERLINRSNQREH